MTTFTQVADIELLAPARNAAVAVAAISHGADAVYMGASSHGARAAAGNSLADIARVCDFAHRFDARVYVTVNTIIYNDELRRVEQLVGDLYKVGVDALIVQDLAMLRLDIPPISLHASTQCDIRTPARARFLQDLGFSQLVLPRELTLDEISQMRRAVSVPLEAFVHGALCVSYSGDCRASLLCGGRSANRGECAQICRLPYDLIDGNGQTLVSGKHLLSLRDLNRLSQLPELIGAGVSSLKIEGRLKDEGYVKNVVSAYDLQLRRLGATRTSSGHVERTFTPDIAKSFNRGFTRYFFDGPKPAPGKLGSHDSPKSLGQKIAVVTAVSGKKVKVGKLRGSLTNGDGLTYGGNGGFRVNKMLSPTEFLTSEPAAGLKPGMELRRNFDKQFADELTRDTAFRVIDLDLTLRRAGLQLVLESNDGVAATVDFSETQQARSPQLQARLKVIGKLGGTIYRLINLDDRLGDEFIPASVLTQLRHSYVATLDAARAARFRRPLRAPEKADAIWPEGKELTFHANVANDLAEQVYRQHGVSGRIDRALEVAPTTEGETEAMQMRYCLRRELGKCLREPSGRDWPEPLTLRAPGKSDMPDMRLHFDCATCRMLMHLQKTRQ